MRMNPSEMTRPPIPGMESLLNLIEAKRKHNEIYTRCLVLFSLVLRNESSYDDEFKSQYALLQEARTKIDEETLTCDEDEDLRLFTNKMRHYGDHGLLLNKDEHRIPVAPEKIDVVVTPEKKED